MISECIKNNTPPEIDGSKATTESIKTIYADSDDESIVDLMAYKKDLAIYTDLGKQIKELQSQQDKAANRIKAFMGESSGGYCEGFKASWKSQSRQIFDVNKFAEAHPDIDISTYYKKTSYRVFKITESKGA